MTDLRQAAQQALEALVTCCAEEWRTLNNFGMKQVYDEKKVNPAIAALHAALAEPEHWGAYVSGRVYVGAVPEYVQKLAQSEGVEITLLYTAAPTPQPEQQPVAWVECDGELVWNNREAAIGRNLYTAPTPRKPLTDYINAAGINGADSPHMVVEKLQSAIERAHGIGGGE